MGVAGYAPTTPALLSRLFVYLRVLRGCKTPEYLLLALLLLWATASRAEVVTRPLAPGITYTQEVVSGDAPLIINALKIDLKASGVRVRYGQAQDFITLNGPTKGRETLTRLATRQGALAAVNADFFPYTGDPVGLAIRDGELLSEPLDYRACLGIGPQGILMDVLTPVATVTNAQGQTLPLNGINRTVQDGEIVALTPAYATSPKVERTTAVAILVEVKTPVRLSQEVRGMVQAVPILNPKDPLPQATPNQILLVASGKAAETLNTFCHAGEPVTFRFDLVSNGLPPARGRFPSRGASLRGRELMPIWTEVEQAVGGGPWLVRDGQVAVDGEAENFDRESFVERRHPRTAAGVTAEGRLLLVTVDGRQAWSRGVSLVEMAEQMRRLGAVQAINLDGGGSTTMVVGGVVVNAPSENAQRPIANALLIYGEPPASEPHYQLRPDPDARISLVAGDSLAFALQDAEGKPVATGTSVVWGTDNGLGFVSQQGVFRAFQAGTGEVAAWVGGKRLTHRVTILAGPPAQLKATLENLPDNPPDLQRLLITVRDRYGNPIADYPVKVTLRGGDLVMPAKTDKNGQATTEVVWDAPAGQRELLITAGNAPPIKRKL